MIDLIALLKCRDILLQSRRLLFITGAGVSADSGLPTYRGVSGLYESSKTDEGYSIEEALSGEMLRHQPEITWKYLSQIIQASRGKMPNRAHEVIAELQDNWDVCVITQNIDGLHSEAGSRNVIEMHGNLRGLSCMSCKHAEPFDLPDAISTPPLCRYCHDILRPNVVLFGEMLPEQALSRYYEELSKGFDVVFSVGTTSVFPYIYGPIDSAIAMGIPCIEVNPQVTGISDRVTIKFACRAAEWFATFAELHP